MNHWLDLKGPQGLSGPKTFWIFGQWPGGCEIVASMHGGNPVALRKWGRSITAHSYPEAEKQALRVDREESREWDPIRNTWMFIF